MLSTLQGLGRRGYARFGVNAGGAMDPTAVRLLNILLGNAEGEAAVEMHFPAAAFVAESACVVALGGADFDAEVDGVAAELWRATWVATWMATFMGGFLWEGPGKACAT